MPRIIALMLCCCTFVACSSADQKTEVPVRTTGGTATAQAAASASLRVSKMASTDTVIITGAASDVADRSTFTAYAIDGRIARIEEVSASMPADGAASSDNSQLRFRRAYTFDTMERPAHFTEERTQLVSNPNASPSQQHVTIVIDWSGGIVVNSTKHVDGAEKVVQPWDTDNVRRRVDQLLTLARPGIAKLQDRP